MEEVVQILLHLLCSAGMPHGLARYSKPCRLLGARTCQVNADTPVRCDFQTSYPFVMLTSPCTGLYYVLKRKVYERIYY